MQKALTTIKEFLTTKRMVAFYWTTLNGFIGVIIVGVADLNWVYTPMIIAFLNGITKYVNVEIIQKRYV
jgi:hypothetical protein